MRRHIEYSGDVKRLRISVFERDIRISVGRIEDSVARTLKTLFYDFKQIFCVLAVRPPDNYERKRRTRSERINSLFILWPRTLPRNRQKNLVRNDTLIRGRR